MDTRSILLALMVMIFFLINCLILRDLLFGIFLGSKSKKSAAKIKSEQKFFSNLTMRYIKPHLTKYQDAYRKWQIARIINASIAVLSLAAFITMIVTGVEFWIVAILCGVLTIYCAVLFMLMMTQTTTSDNKKNRKGSPWKFEQ